MLVAGILEILVIMIVCDQLIIIIIIIITINHNIHHFYKDKGSDHEDDFGTEQLIEPTQILARKAQFNARVVIPPVG